MAKVNKSEGCWLWTGWINPDGYGRFYIAGRGTFAHRVSYEHAAGPIPAGLTLDHLCRVRRCVNPAHLEPVTSAENSRRGVSAQAAKTQCLSGHPYDLSNTEIRRSEHGVHRRCRTCHRQQEARRRAANRDRINERKRQRYAALARSE